MKRAPDRVNSAEAAVVGKPDSTGRAGFLPSKLATVTAEVLARLLNHERLTSLAGVFDASTTRLSAVTHYLQGDYGWHILSTPKAVGCADGRVAFVCEYHLTAEAIAAANAAGAGAWCKDVRRARAALRKKAAEAEREAARRNEAMAAARHRAPGQFVLDLGGAA